MKRNKTIEKAIEITNQLINDIIFLCEMRTKSTYFTRTGKMGFRDLIMFIMNFIKKSIQQELDIFFKDIKKDGKRMTKQGYSEARKKISPLAFTRMIEAVISWFYGDDDFKTFKGFRLSAVDGVVLELNNSEELRREFGYVENQAVKLARALGSGLYDVENDMMITAIIDRYDTSERDLAIKLIDKLKELGLKNDLILFDRGYPSKDLISYLENSGIKYLMRVSKSFLKVVNEAKKEDQIVKAEINKKEVKIRVVRFGLKSGEEEVLITNVLEEDWEVNEFKELYAKRWGIETKYDELKNRLQIENFTGDSKIAIEQDFYASVYLSNLVALAKAEANENIQKKNEIKNLKYEYKVNTNMLIGKLKDSLVTAMLVVNPWKRRKILNEIKQEIERNTIPIRPGRSFKRNTRPKANKYSLNKKKCV